MALAGSGSKETPFVCVLYGSAARGDSDNLSDVDVLVVDDVKNRHHQYENASVVRYGWSEMAEMRAYGSLFLRHLRLHSRVLTGNDIGKIAYSQVLDTIPSYDRVRFDLTSFRSAVDDSRGAIELQDTSPEFELASLATVMRHCSILGCYLLGVDEFSRTRPVEICCDAFNLGTDAVKLYKCIYRFRIALARGHPFPPSPSMSMVEDSITFAKDLVLRVEQYATFADLS